jgi:hypothetical protein
MILTHVYRVTHKFAPKLLVKWRLNEEKKANLFQLEVSLLVGASYAALLCTAT